MKVGREAAQRRGMPNFQTLLESSPLPDLRLRRRAAELVQSMVRGQSSSSLGCLAPADRTQESLRAAPIAFSTMTM